ncbi:response regulator [Streptomyces antimicrobicus]|uniref:Response regulator transcription factor n=1 Tax=Streptomyces antimicrobicus TaxID=2883108 RepID=A0ABS8BDU3_9ACTN|nr:response regulator transcription factor [Streptomyces antimicrobicus]MCB5182752.1 response regulator transcription factor [Streptomyces antimicrobicus]
MPSVLVVDDQYLIRSGLAALLRAAPGIELVGEAADGEEAVRLAAELRPDVVLMDIRMPGVDGITATERILADAATRSGPLPKVFVLTTFDLDEYVYGALRAGACGFLLKDTPADRLLAAIETVHAGDMLFSPAVVAHLVQAYTPRVAAPRASHPGLEVLTPREVEVLGLVGAGLSNSDIAERLVLSAATIKTHVHRCMSKLGLSSRAQAVVFAYETGLASRP